MNISELKKLAENLAHVLQGASVRQRDGKRVRGILVAYDIKTGEIRGVATSFSVIYLRTLGDVKTFTLWEEFTDTSQDEFNYAIDFEGQVDAAVLSAISPVIDSFIEIVRKDED